MRKFLMAGAMVLAVAASAKAAPIVGFGDPLSNLALIGGTQQGFDAVASGQYNVLTLGNVTYTGVGAAFDIDADFNGSFNTTGGQSMSNDFDLIPSQFRFDFATPISAFAFNFGASDNNWLLQAYDSSNVLLESLLIAPTQASNAGHYFGLALSGISYATLVDQQDVIQQGDYVFVDRFTTSAVSAVPEPGMLFLLGTGLAMGVRRYRRS